MGMESAERILVVKLSSLGDVVHVTPCLRALRRRWPQARIVMAVESRFAAIVRHNPNVDEIIEPSSQAQGWWGRVREVRRLLARHVAPRFDLALDFQGKARSALWVYLSHARIQAGRGAFRPGWQCVVRPDLDRHAVRVCADVAEANGIPVDDLTPEIFLSDEADAAVGALLARVDCPDAGFILLNPFSRWRSKEWPLDRFAQLVQALAGERRLPILLSGSSERRRDAERLARMVPPGSLMSLVGRLTLEQAMCLYKRAGLMVTGDSGPMHIAAALGTRLVALFGPTFPERTGPWGTGHVILQKRRPSHPHAYKEDPQRECISAVDVAAVHQAVTQALTT